jgi:hypothetical protein
MPDPAPTFADPKPPGPDLIPHQNPFFYKEGPLSSQRGRALIEKVEVVGGKVGNVDQAVAGMRAGFRACYHRGLASDAEQRGSLRVEARLNRLGAVTHATAARTGRLGQEVTDCVVRRVSIMTFAEPEGDGVSVIISVSFNWSDASSEPPDAGSAPANPQL